MKRLRTTRLILRELQHRDAEDIYAYSCKEEIVGMSGMRVHTSIEMTKEYITHEQAKSETYAILLNTSNRLIGTVSLRKQYNDSDLDIRLISCIIHPHHWGRGYAPEAIEELIRYAFDELKVHKLIGGHFSFNEQSASVNKKLGFVYEGTQREVYRYKGKLYDAVEYGMLYSDYIKR